MFQIIKFVARIKGAFFTKKYFGIFWQDFVSHL